MKGEAISAYQLESGHWHIRGRGVCNWSQPPHWPCDEATLREHAFPEADEAFIREATDVAEKRSRRGR